MRLMWFLLPWVSSVPYVSALKILHIYYVMYWSSFVTNWFLLFYDRIGEVTYGSQIVIFNILFSFFFMSLECITIFQKLQLTFFNLVYWMTFFPSFFHSNFSAVPGDSPIQLFLFFFNLLFACILFLLTFLSVGLNSLAITFLLLIDSLVGCETDFNYSHSSFPLV